MAEVYLAVLRGAAGFERRVALKKILPVYAGIEEFTKLFRDEARIWAVLNHSGVVQVYDFGQHQGDHWIAMEFIDGPDLEEVLDRCRRRGIHPPVDVVIHLGHRLASALEYAHGVRDPSGEELHIIHRDVSPPNILLSVQGEVKLTDFGVAKASTRASLTRPGVLRGKYAYMSPEQVQHKPIDHRSDLFGLGILLYETLTGVNPFEGPTDYQTIESVGRAEVEPAGFLRPDTPAELDRILLGLLEPDPELRYQTGGELRRDLAALMLERPEADEPETLVAFLRDLFPERTPQAQSSGKPNPGVPAWEALAHVITVYDVPVPERFPEGPGAAVRLEERPPLRDSLWVSAPPNGDSSSAVSNEETVSGAVGEELRLAPPLRSATPADEWDDVSRNEWSVEGEDPDEALQPTQHAAPIQLGLLADHANLAPLPWGDDPEDEVRHPSEHASDDGYPTLRDTDPGIATLDRTTLQED
jgi:serine/threonine-protein kinase